MGEPGFEPSSLTSKQQCEVVNIKPSSRLLVGIPSMVVVIDGAKC